MEGVRCVRQHRKRTCLPCALGHILQHLSAHRTMHESSLGMGIGVTDLVGGGVIKAAITTLLRSLAAVFVALQQQVDPTALGLCKVLTHYNCFASLILLNDVLSAVNRLSLVFQLSSIDFTIVWPLLNSAIASLETLQQESANDFEGKVRQIINKTTTEVNALR